MIHVSNLVKAFPRVTAVDSLSFDVSSQEVVGFLGPNGAGKTTTMRILTGYLPASAGEATICGHDVIKNSLEVRRHIGYLPESVPLYTDMRVREYLRYRAALKGVPRSKLREQLSSVSERCSLTEVYNRVIGQLSRGYRQRVGLADALLGSPEVLILDEPTVGLDPNQIRQVRSLIAELATEHTVLLSSHILPEVEAVCQRVLILNRGRLVAQGTPQELRERFKQAAPVRVEVRVADPVKAAEEMEAVPGVGAVTIESRGEYSVFRVFSESGEDVRGALFKLIVQRSWDLRDLHADQASLEEIFVEITQ
ncbi:MAG: ATP-binding cassette domain-containing protein [Candidatus Omnitrophica bacterium]|nr:ATP-binding cassette domain-containing protein [Candidatus Omnitrophota bacterium]